MNWGGFSVVYGLVLLAVCTLPHSLALLLPAMLWMAWPAISRRWHRKE